MQRLLQMPTEPMNNGHSPRGFMSISHFLNAKSMSDKRSLLEKSKRRDIHGYMKIMTNYRMVLAYHRKERQSYGSFITNATRNCSLFDCCHRDLEASNTISAKSIWNCRRRLHH